MTAGTLEVDHKERVINYMVDNGLDSCQDVNWGMLSRLPMFRGEKQFGSSL